MRAKWDPFFRFDIPVSSVNSPWYAKNLWKTLLSSFRIEMFIIEASSCTTLWQSICYPRLYVRL